MELELHTYNEYPEPTQIVLEEGMNIEEKISSSQNQILGMKRNLIRLASFNSEEEFINWQKESPREIFEITPKVFVHGNVIKTRIYVTYAGGIIS